MKWDVSVLDTLVYTPLDGSAALFLLFGFHCMPFFFLECIL